MGNCFSLLKKNKVSPEVKKVAKSPAKSNDSRLPLFFERENRIIDMKPLLKIRDVGEEISRGSSKSFNSLETKSANPLPISVTSLEDILGSSSFVLDNDTKHNENVYDADQLIQELDTISCIRVNNDHSVTNSNQETAIYDCNLPRPITRRGPVTVPRRQSCLMHEVVSAEKEHGSRDLKREGRNKQQVSIASANCARDKLKVGVQKCVRFVNGLEKVDERPVTPLVYDDKEMGLIDQIKEEYGIR